MEGMLAEILDLSLLPEAWFLEKISKQDIKKLTRINTLLSSKGCVQSLVKYYKTKYVWFYFNAQITA